MADKSTYDIAVLPGDGIGPELTEEVIKALNVAQQIFNDFSLNFNYYEAGAGLYLRTGEILPREAYDGIAKSDAIYKAPVGLPDAVLEEGRCLTYDLGGTSKTNEVGDAIVQKMEVLAE